MAIMDRTAPGARAVSRALAVLVVLLGLLAMHGVDSTHHAAAATTAVQHAAAQHQTAPADAPEQHQHAAVRTGTQEAAPAGPGCDEDCPDLTVLCAAVLAGAALALLLARRRTAPLPLAPTRPRAPTLAPPARHARPPDPVKELCVSRT